MKELLAIVILFTFFVGNQYVIAQNSNDGESNVTQNSDDGESNVAQDSEQGESSRVEPTETSGGTGSPGSFREKETHGIGFGIEGTDISILGTGISIFYDYALDGTYQIHIFGTTVTYSRSSLEKDNEVTTSRTLLGATLRYFPRQDLGFFFGGGLGLANAKQTFKQQVDCSVIFTSLNPPECNGKEGETLGRTTESTYSALAVWGSVGWQGYDGYYFTIGLKAGGNVALSKEDNTDEVLDIADHKKAADDDWKKGTAGPSGLVMGFGWHF